MISFKKWAVFVFSHFFISTYEQQIQLESPAEQQGHEPTSACQMPIVFDGAPAKPRSSAFGD